MSSIKLQISLDTLSIEQSMELLDRISGLIDIVEVGTPFIMEEGMEPVRRIRERFPQLTILADTKIADGASIETAGAIRAGADIITVLAVSEDATVRDCIEEAHKHGKKVLVDMIAVRNLEERGRQIDEMGADFICVHNGYDTQNTDKNPLDELLIIRKTVKGARTAVAGGIKLSTLPEIAEAGPDLVIVGSAVTSSADPAEMCRKIRELL